MQTIHLEYQGKSARVSLQSLPDAKQRPEVKTRTSAGEVTPARVTNGINLRIDPLKLTPADSSPISWPQPFKSRTWARGLQAMTSSRPNKLQLFAYA